MFGGNTLEKIEKLGQKGKTGKILRYASSKKAEERAAAAAALGNAANDEAFNALLNLLHDSDAAVCISAAEGLKKMGRAAAVEHLRHAAAASDDEAVKAAFQDAAASISRNGRQ
jgi:HEAT repeat protein